MKKCFNGKYFPRCNGFSWVCLNPIEPLFLFQSSIYHGLALFCVLLLKSSPSLGEADAREIMGMDFSDYTTTFVVLIQHSIQIGLKIVLNLGLMAIYLLYTGHSNSGPYSSLY